MILRYLKQSSKVCLSFVRSEPSLKGYANSNMTKDLDSRKSTSGYLFTFPGELYHGGQSYKSVFHYLQ